MTGAKDRRRSHAKEKVRHHGSDDGLYTGSRSPALEARCRPPVHNPALASNARSLSLSLIDRIKHNLHTARYAIELSSLPWNSRPVSAGITVQVSWNTHPHGPFEASDGQSVMLGVQTRARVARVLHHGAAAAMLGDRSTLCIECTACGPTAGIAEPDRRRVRPADGQRGAGAARSGRDRQRPGQRHAGALAPPAAAGSPSVDHRRHPGRARGGLAATSQPQRPCAPHGRGPGTGRTHRGHPGASWATRHSGVRSCAPMVWSEPAGAAAYWAIASMAMSMRTSSPT